MSYIHRYRPFVSIILIHLLYDTSTQHEKEAAVAVIVVVKDQGKYSRQFPIDHATHEMCLKMRYSSFCYRL